MLPPSGYTNSSTATGKDVCRSLTYPKLGTLYSHEPPFDMLVSSLFVCRDFRLHSSDAHPAHTCPGLSPHTSMPGTSSTFLGILHM
jgi:hypothetical protein